MTDQPTTPRQPEELYNQPFTYQPHAMRGMTHTRCHLQVLKQGNVVLVIATELHGNPGKSITNSPGPLAEAVVSTFGLCPPIQRITWIEHYNDQLSYGHSDGLDISRSKHDSYSQVSYTWEYDEGKQGYTVLDAEYSHITAEELERLRSFKPFVTLDVGLPDGRGTDGNIFTIMAFASGALREAGQADQVDAMRKATTRTHSYQDAIAAITAYVEIVDTHEE